MTDQESPETQPKPQLTQSQVKRMSQPMIAMVVTMVVTMAAVGAFLMMNPEPDPDPVLRDENVEEEAYFAAGVAEFAPLAPDVPESWSANYARWEAGAVPVWEVGYTTEAVEFIGFAQTDQANPTWLAEQTGSAASSGTVEIDGATWERLDGEDRVYYLLEAEENTVDGTTVIVNGDADKDEFQTALEEITAALGVEAEGPEGADPEEAGSEEAGSEVEDPS